MRTERRAHSRIEMPIDVVFTWATGDAEPGEKERTVLDNISRGGARVMTGMTGAQVGDEVDVAEVDGDFATRATVRHAVVVGSSTRRLGLEFLGGTAPERLLPGAAARPAEAPRARPSSEDDGAREDEPDRGGDPRPRGTPRAEQTDTDPRNVPAAAERRSSTRLSTPLDVRITPAGRGSDPPSAERTLAENIARGGARVATANPSIRAADVLRFEEVGGDFETRATVRHAYVGDDHIRRLNLKFLDRPAPDRLAGSSSVPGHGAARPETEVAPPEEAATSGAPRLTRPEIVETYQALKTGTLFDILGISRSSDLKAVREAYRRRARLFHPDARHDPSVGDLDPEIGAVFIKLGEAYEVLSDPRRRGEYESRLGPNRDRRPPRESAPAARTPASETGPTTPPSLPPEPEPAVAPGPPEPEETNAALVRAIVQGKKLLVDGRHWDAIQVLETALTRAQDEPRLRHKLQVLLARGLRANAQWTKRAEEVLRTVLGEDDKDVGAWFELGLLYKGAGFRSRAERAFTRVLDLVPGHKAASAEIADL